MAEKFWFKISVPSILEKKSVQVNDIAERYTQKASLTDKYLELADYCT